eukprot:gene2969-4665_t
MSARYRVSTALLNRVKIAESAEESGMFPQTQSLYSDFSGLPAAPASIFVKARDKDAPPWLVDMRVLCAFCTHGELEAYANTATAKDRRATASKTSDATTGCPGARQNRELFADSRVPEESVPASETTAEAGEVQQTASKKKGPKARHEDSRRQTAHGSEDAEGKMKGDRKRRVPAHTPSGETCQLPEYKRDSTEGIRAIYARIATRLKACAAAVHAEMKDTDEGSFEYTLPRVEAVFPPGVMRKAIALYCDRGSRVNDVLCYMLCVSFLERTLAELTVWHHERSGARAQITMRELKITDLLQSPGIATAFGPECILVLRSFLGPLHGLMLRNLAWHNFISPAEWVPQHTSLLLSIALSIAHPANGYAMQSSSPSGRVPVSIVLRQLRLPPDTQCMLHDEAARVVQKLHPHVSCFTAAPISSDFIDRSTAHAPFAISEGRVSSHKGGPLFELSSWIAHMAADFNVCLHPPSVASCLGRDNEAPLLAFLRDSPFFLSSREPLWAASLGKHWCGDAYSAAALVTVSLEAGLRRLHAALADRDDRWVAPAKNELFLTIDEILEPGSAVVAGLPAGAAALLFDHWVWKEGVRARDDLAHGSVHPDAVCAEAFVPLLAVGLYLGLMSFFPDAFRVSRSLSQLVESHAGDAACPSIRDGISYSKSQCLAPIVSFVEGYRPQLSPWALYEAESGLFATRGLAALRDCVRLIQARGNGFPPPAASSADSSVAAADGAADAADSGLRATGDVAKKNERSSGDPNTLPSDVPELRVSFVEFCDRRGFAVVQLEHPAIQSVEFQGKCSNATNKRIVVLNTLRRIVASCHEFCARVSETYHAAFQLVWSRRAYKKQRIAYARLQNDIPTLLSMVELAYLFVEMNKSHAFPREEQLRECCLNYVYSLSLGYLRRKA